MAAPGLCTVKFSASESVRRRQEWLTLRLSRYVSHVLPYAADRREPALRVGAGWRNPAHAFLNYGETV